MELNKAKTINTNVTNDTNDTSIKFVINGDILNKTALLINQGNKAEEYYIGMIAAIYDALALGKHCAEWHTPANDLVALDDFTDCVRLFENIPGIATEMHLESIERSGECEEDNESVLNASVKFYW